MAVAWLLGSLSAFAGLPSLVGEIVAGFLLGPPLADFVPYPGALVLLGNIGLIGLILESGISLDLPQLKENGHRALLMATAGAVLPLAVGFSVGRWIGQDVPSAIAAGACFASTSLGVASNALNTGDVINTPLGQLIVTSSVLDDVYGLIMLSLLQVIGDPDSQAFDFVLPFLSSFGYLFVLGGLGLTIFPRIIEEKILPVAPETIRDQVAMVLLLLFVTAYMLLLNESKASYLTGVFLAGLTFCKIRSVHAFFVNYARPIHVWLLRVFFSATIGFQVPITRFQDPYVLKWGTAFRKWLAFLVNDISCCSLSTSSLLTVMTFHAASVCYFCKSPHWAHGSSQQEARNPDRLSVQSIFQRCNCNIAFHGLQRGIQCDCCRLCSESRALCSRCVLSGDVCHHVRMYHRTACAH
jgi:Kef-type K+ transport system membrane component KefB